MRSPVLVVAVALATASVVPGVTLAVSQQAEAQTDASAGAIGLPIYTSDGEHVGEVVQVSAYGDKPALRAEIGKFLGLGATTAIIPAGMFDRKADRIELTMTAAEVRDTVAKQK